MNTAQQTLAKVKRLLIRSGGEDGIRGLSRAFNIMDDDSDGSISHAEFVKGLKELGLNLTDRELQSVWAAFDRDGDGSIKPTEFITGLRGSLSPYRRALLQRLWKVFEKDTNGAVSLRSLHRRFDPTRHPQVIRGEVDPDTIAKQFSHSFDVQTNPDGTVTKQELEQYYAGVSGLMDSDSQFACLIRGCWHLPGTNDEETTALAFADENAKFEATQSLSTKEETLAKLQVQDSFNATIQTHKKLLQSQRVGYRNLGRRFRTADSKHTGYLSQDDFLDALWKGRLYFDDKAALKHLDTNGDGTCDYILYMAHVKGELPPARQLMIERLWKSFPRDKNDCTELNIIHKRYHAPDGPSRSQFLDAWDRMNSSEYVVAFEEFEEWLIPLSVTISLDAQFEDTLRRQWG